MWVVVLATALALGQDFDGDGVERGFDCDDTDADAYPGAPELCDGDDNDCNGFADETVDCGCEPGLHNGHTYQFCETTAEWTNARDACQTLGYHLVTVDNQAENVFVLSTAAGRNGAPWWLGLNDFALEGTFVWDYGVSPYRNFDNNNGQPDNTGDQDCVAGNGFTAPGPWSDERCTRRLPFVCETCADNRWYRDQDRDGYGDPGQGFTTCHPPAGVVANALDCDDRDPDVNPDGVELPDDGIDQNCDGRETCHRDRDGDHFGGSGFVPGDLDCRGPGQSPNDRDCDDDDDTIYPGAPEIPGDGTDQDCDLVDTCFVDVDEDTWGRSVTTPGQDLSCRTPQLSPRQGDCDDTDDTIYPGAPEIPADRVDQDCDLVDDCYVDGDRDRWGRSAVFPGDDLSCDGPGEAWRPGDCDDTDANVNPDATEQVADDLDQDCDGLEVCYVDGDGDRWGADGEYVQSPDLSCRSPGISDRPGDCADADPDIHPGAPEAPADDVDQDCDGREACYVDADEDTWGGSDLGLAPGLDCRVRGSSPRSGDCDDTDDRVFPGAPELVADRTDQDCDGADTCYLDSDRDDFGSTTAVPGDDLSCTNGLQESDVSTDCDDTDRFAYPGAPELPLDGVDQDCDGGDLCLLDRDDDGFGTGSDFVEGADTDCTNGPNETNRGGDCNDRDDQVRPGGSETCGDGVDSDCDGDGGPDDDDDGDGIPWSEEVALGADDCATDSDDDGIDDATEILEGDSDNDGDHDLVDPDDDNDTLATSVEGPRHAEEELGCPNPDGVPNHLDLDSDGDGLLDLEEGLNDLDLDTIPDFLDCSDLACEEDADGDGIVNCVEPEFGTDPTRFDTDDDLLSDLVELGGDPLELVALDSDGDTLPDALDEDDDDDSLLTRAEDLDGDGDPRTDDSDGDLTPNYLDPDDDGDGVNTMDEDTDGDGDPSDDDSDGDGVPDFLDQDDGDGPRADSDGDGIDNGTEEEIGSDPFDIDSDGDGRLDQEEVGSLTAPTDTDLDGNFDLIDDDDDGDTLLSIDEGWLDLDADGLPNALDLDSDGDGILDEIEGLDEDNDCDGFPAAQDPDEFDGGCVGTGGTDDTDASAIDNQGGACGCAVPTGSSAWWLPVAALLAARRRSRTSG